MYLVDNAEILWNVFVIELFLTQPIEKHRPFLCCKYQDRAPHLLKLCWEGKKNEKKNKTFIVGFYNSTFSSIYTQNNERNKKKYTIEEWTLRKHEKKKD